MVLLRELLSESPESEPVSLADFSVRRAVAATMLTLILIVLGTASFFRIPVDLLPDLKFPVAAIYTEYDGVGPEEIENSLTKIVEGAASQVDGVKELHSISERDISIVVVEFEWGTNMDLAVQNVREKLDQIPDFMFPDDADRPRIERYDPSDIPLMGLGLSGGGNTPHQLRKIAEDYLQDPIAGVEGVAAVMVFGGTSREILVAVDQDKLAATGLGMDAVVGCLNRENLNLSTGNVKEGHKDYLVRALGQFKSLSEIENTILGTRGERTIRLRDVAKVYDTFKEDRVLSRDNKNPSVMMMVVKQSGGNSVQVSRRVWEKIDGLKKHLPPGVKIVKNFDSADFINRAIADVWGNLWQGSVLAIIILFLFLRHVRPVIIISLAIPISLLSSFLPMFFSGMTINMISLGGLALAVGMVVDNSIVVIENIFRHMDEEGEDRITASSRGTNEVAGAITGSTLTTVAVFIPIMFTTGLAARIFTDLALTVTFSLLSSLLIAVTVVPMMASKLLSVRESGVSESRVYTRVKSEYRRLIGWVLDHKLITIGLTNLLWISSIYILVVMPKEFMPTANDETFMIEVELPRGTRLEETDKLTRRVEDIIMGTPEVKSEHAVIGHASDSDSEDSRQAFLIINLKDISRRTRTVEQVNDEIRKRVLRLPGITKYNFVNLQSRSIGAGGGKPIEVTIYGNDLETLSKLSQEAARRMNHIKGVVDVEERFTFGSPELQVRFDRERLAQVGLSVAHVARILETAIKGTVASRYEDKGEEFDIRVRLNERDRDSLLDMEQIPLVTPSGGQMRLSDVTSVEVGSGPVRIFRENQKRSVSLLANTYDRDLDSAVRDIQRGLSASQSDLGFLDKLRERVSTLFEKAKNTGAAGESESVSEPPLELPMGYYIEYGGSYKDMRESQVQLGLAFLLAILLVYMIMAAEFESLIQPLTIMFAVPFAFTGSIWAIFLARMTLSVNSAIGIVMLAGIIVNNGIVLIEYVTQLRAKGMSVREALIEGGGTRLRPILMTTLTTTLALIPMAVMGGSGSEMRRPLAVSLMGGLVFGSILTLLVIPTAYYVLDSIAHRIYVTFMRVLHPGELEKKET